MPIRLLAEWRTQDLCLLLLPNVLLELITAFSVNSSLKRRTSDGEWVVSSLFAAVTNPSTDIIWRGTVSLSPCSYSYLRAVFKLYPSCLLRFQIRLLTASTREAAFQCKIEESCLICLQSRVGLHLNHLTTCLVVPLALLCLSCCSDPHEKIV
jgi:hypothetical protein